MLKHLLSSVSMRPFEIAADTIKVFTRERIGIRDLNLVTMFVVAILLMWNVSLMTLPLDVLLWWQPWLRFLRLPSFHSDPWLSCFAVMMLGAAWFRHWQMMRLLRSGQQWHTKSRGRTYLEFLTKFRFIQLSHVYRFWEPAAWLMLGLLMRGPLGDWIIFASLCLAVVERQHNLQELQRYFDKMDAVIETEQHVREDAHLRGDIITAGVLSIEQSSGLSIGILTEITPSAQVIRANYLTVIKLSRWGTGLLRPCRFSPRLT